MSAGVTAWLLGAVIAGIEQKSSAGPSLQLNWLKQGSYGRHLAAFVQARTVSASPAAFADGDDAKGEGDACDLSAGSKDG